MQSNFWKKLKKPIFVTAPMSGVTDQAFRHMLLKYGKPDVLWTEFISVEGLFSKNREGCLKTLKFSPEEHPIVAQIFGSNPSDFKKAAGEIEKLGFDESQLIKYVYGRRGKKAKRFKYGSAIWKIEGQELTEPAEKPCHDCGVKKGQLHVIGCDFELCPICEQQLLECCHHP